VEVLLLVGLEDRAQLRLGGEVSTTSLIRSSSLS
jgi:hypothetical protein